MFDFYEVGGHVRDGLLGLQSKDIDYVAVPILPIVNKNDTLHSITDWFTCLSNYLKLEKYDIFIETPDYYTIRARFPKGHVNEGVTADFVLARKELGYKQGTREPIVVPGTLYDDLQRRDFTVNAMAKDLKTGTIVDPFRGQDDLKNKVLRTPISGKITFADDPLRLLRAVRFAVTKGFLICDEIEEIIHTFDYNFKFAIVSDDRIRDELFKCFKHDTQLTLYYLNKFWHLSDYIFSKTSLWLKPTNEQ